MAWHGMAWHGPESAIGDKPKPLWIKAVRF
jgi:hypothetical protein